MCARISGNAGLLASNGIERFIGDSVAPVVNKEGGIGGEVNGADEAPRQITAPPAQKNT